MGEHTRGIIRRLQRTRIFILLVNNVLYSLKTRNNTGFDNFVKPPHSVKRTVCTAKIFDTWIELTVSNEKIHLCECLPI